MTRPTTATAGVPLEPLEVPDFEVEERPAVVLPLDTAVGVGVAPDVFVVRPLVEDVWVVEPDAGDV